MKDSHSFFSCYRMNRTQVPRNTQTQYVRSSCTRLFKVGNLHPAMMPLILFVAQHEKVWSLSQSVSLLLSSHRRFSQRFNHPLAHRHWKPGNVYLAYSGAFLFSDQLVVISAQNQAPMKNPQGHHFLNLFSKAHNSKKLLMVSPVVFSGTSWNRACDVLKMDVSKADLKNHMTI